MRGLGSPGDFPMAQGWSQRDEAMDGRPEKRASLFSMKDSSCSQQKTEKFQTGLYIYETVSNQ